eukprot:6636970-Pyramimonas_sp.AAC.1
MHKLQDDLLKHDESLMLMKGDGDQVQETRRDLLFFSVKHINAARTKLPAFATRVVGDSLIIQPMTLKTYDHERKVVVLLLESPGGLTLDSLQTLSLPMLNTSALMSMKSWHVSNELMYFLEGFPVPKGFEEAWQYVMHELCKTSEREAVEQGRYSCVPFVLTASGASADESRLMLMRRLAEAG